MSKSYVTWMTIILFFFRIDTLKLNTVCGERKKIYLMQWKTMFHLFFIFRLKIVLHSEAKCIRHHKIYCRTQKIFFFSFSFAYTKTLLTVIRQRNIKYQIAHIICIWLCRFSVVFKEKKKKTQTQQQNKISYVIYLWTYFMCEFCSH